MNAHIQFHLPSTPPPPFAHADRDELLARIGAHERLLEEIAREDTETGRVVREYLEQERRV